MDGASCTVQGAETMIKVITQSTSERNEETKSLFEAIRPLLDAGYGYMNALIKIGFVEKVALKHNYYNRAWFKDLKAYGKSQGYPYAEYSGKGRK